LRTSLLSAQLTPDQWDELHFQALSQLVRTETLDGLVAHNEYVLGLPVEPHHRLMLEHEFEGIATRTNTVNLLPRGAAKTTHGNTGLCSWLVANFPDIAIGLMTNTQDMADAFSKAIRNTLELNKRFIRLYGNLKSDQKWTDKEWVRKDSGLIGTNNSTMFARGVGGAIISKRFDILILDDILDKENTATPEQRDAVNAWLLQTVLPCLKPDGVVVVLGTRWAVEDTYELLVADENTQVGTAAGEPAMGKGWDLLLIPALTDANGGPVDLNDHENMTSYWPGYWTVEKLMKKRVDLGTPMFMCAYQNDVEGLQTGNIFPGKFSHFDQLEPGHSYILRMGVDLASSEKERADWTARAVTAEDTCRCALQGHFYVLSVVRDKRETQHAEFIYEGWLAYPEIDLVLCEDQQFQSTLIQEVMADYPRIPIEGVSADKDKTTRARAVAAKYEAGRVHHRATLADSDFERELRAFPKGHDDMVDALGYSMDLGGDEFVFGSVTRR